MRKSIVFMMLVSLFCGCTENESQQYEKAKQSKSIEILDSYLQKFPDAPSEHIDTISLIRQNLMEDSLFYANILASGNAIERYELEKKYINEFSNGIHIAEVKQMTDTDKKAAEDLIKKMSVFDLAEYGYLEELTFDADYHSKNEYNGSEITQKFNIKLNMRDGTAGWHYDNVQIPYAGWDPFHESGDVSGSWQTIYVNRGDKSIKSFDIECGSGDFYTTEDLDLLYDNYYDFRNGNNGKNGAVLKIYNIKKKIVVNGEIISD